MDLPLHRGLTASITKPKTLNKTNSLVHHGYQAQQHLNVNFTGMGALQRQLDLSLIHGLPLAFVIWMGAWMDKATLKQTIQLKSNSEHNPGQAGVQEHDENQNFFLLHPKSIRNNVYTFITNISCMIYQYLKI